MARFLNRLNRRFQKVRVFALVGDPGTGKSFRARLIMEKYGIPLMIDDGLLIRDQHILAGRSSKREKNRFKAIKRAIFEDPDHADEVRRVLAAETFSSILLIGTSDKMVGRIAEKLDLPYPDQIIYIEDVATREEIDTARRSRNVDGKHVIPVPVIAVKKEFRHQLLESITFFLKIHPVLFWKKHEVEKTIVRPDFSRRGHLTISEAALSQMIMHTVEEYNSLLKIIKIIIEPCGTNYEIELKLSLPFGITLSDKLSGLQEYVISQIERFSGLHIERLDITVERIRTPEIVSSKLKRKRARRRFPRVQEKRQDP
ncbi:MAG TPA: hypothetical protein ENN17_04665 [bacterium]|nr:hypothetical protein [bacterium]